MTHAIPSTWPKLLDNEELVAIREICLIIMRDNGECEQSLACIAVVNAELNLRAVDQWLNDVKPLVARPNLYLVQ